MALNPPPGSSLNLSSKVNAVAPSWDSGTSWVLAVKGGCVTAAVAALVTDSSLPASSVKETVTLMTFPASAVTTV